MSHAPSRSEAAAAASDAWSPLVWRAAWGITLLGAALRLWRFADGRSLWADEARLALNITGRSFAELAAPLADGQAAPLLFLWLERAAVEIFGPSDAALRLIPLLASLASLALFLWLVRRTLAPLEAGLALVLFAISEPLVYFASELKQYAVDVTAALAVTAASAPLLVRPAGTLRVVTAAAIGAAAIWLSYPAVFVCAGAGCACLAFGVGDRRSRTGRALLLGIPWLASFAAFYAVAHRGDNTFEYLQRFWAGAFPPLPPRSLADWSWYGRSALGIFEDPGGLAMPAVSLACFVAGSIGLGRTRPGLAALWWLPLGFTVLAAMLRLYPFPTSQPSEYPFHGRLLLFAAPALFVGVAHGVAMLRGGRPGVRSWLVAGVVLLLVLPSLVHAADRAIHPPRFQEMGPLVAFMAPRLEPGDRVLVHHQAVPAFTHYARSHGLPVEELLRPFGSVRDWPRLQRELAEDDAAQRLWLVYAHHRFWKASEDEEHFSRRLLEHGRLLLAHREASASASLYQLEDRHRPTPR